MADAPPPPPFHRSVVGKLTLASVLLVLLVTALLYLATAAHMRRQAEAALKARIDTDLAGLSDIYASGGQRELVRRMDDRIAFSGADEEALYLLVSGPDDVQIGNLKGPWPALDAGASQMGRFLTSTGEPAIGRGTQLDPDLRLLVARRLRPIDALIGGVRMTFLLAGALVALLALVVGFAASRRLQRRLLAIDALHTRMEHGEQVPEHAPRRGSGDEIDQLAGRTQRMLMRQAELIAAYRDVSEHTAHEIRTPLMHLDHRLEKLLRQTADPRVQEGVARGRSDLRSVVRLLESLLDISASRARMGDTGDFERIDLSAMVADVVDIYQDSAEEAGLRLACEVAPGVSFRGNPMQLQRILTNLLDNAFKYCPSGSRIQVTLAPGPMLSVRDDGPGIPDADRERIFSKFFRINAGGSAVGHGLGLALARVLAERHGLRLHLVDDGQPGACFMLESAGNDGDAAP